MTLPTEGADDPARMAAKAAASASVAEDHASKAGDSIKALSQQVSELSEAVGALRVAVEANTRRTRWWRAVAVLVTIVIFATSFGVWFYRARDSDLLRRAAVQSCNAANRNASIIADIIKQSAEISENLDLPEPPEVKEAREEFVRDALARLRPVDCIERQS